MPFTFATAVVSDRYNLRGPFIMFWSVVGMAGFAVLLGTRSPWQGYGGTIVGTVGIVSAVPVSLAWVSGNVAGDLKRGTSSARLVVEVSSNSIAFSRYRIRNGTRRFKLRRVRCSKFLSLRNLPDDRRMCRILSSFTYRSALLPVAHFHMVLRSSL